MKKLKLFYNPNSGNKDFILNLDCCIDKFQSAGYEVHFCRSNKLNDIENNIAETEKGYYDAFVVSGGDGTINIVVNAMMKNGLNNVPLGIIPSGTANDFASFLKLPSDIEDACDVILKNNIKEVDLGLIEDKYFVNVCAGGLFSDISQNIDRDFKNMFGKLGYYIKALEQIPNIKPMPVRITNSSEVIEDEIYLFLILNSSGTGGVEKISPSASISDGMFDFVAFRGVPILELSKVLLKFFKGEHLNDESVIFFNDKYVKIENLSKMNILNETDLDGEVGPSMPVEVRNIHKAIKIFVN